MGNAQGAAPGEELSRELEAQLVRHTERVRVAAARYRLPAADVDEIVQEVRIRLWRALEEGGKIREVPASYVYRTAISAAIDLLRRRRARPEEQMNTCWTESDAIPGAAPIGAVRAPDRAIEDAELARIVEQEVAGLSADRALAVRMHLSGYPREEIAELLRWSEARTRHLIYRGLDDLRGRLRARGIGWNE